MGPQLGQRRRRRQGAAIPSQRGGGERRLCGLLLRRLFGQSGNQQPGLVTKCLYQKLFIGLLQTTTTPGVERRGAGGGAGVALMPAVTSVPELGKSKYQFVLCQGENNECLNSLKSLTLSPLAPPQKKNGVRTLKGALVRLNKLFYFYVHT